MKASPALFSAIVARSLPASLAVALVGQSAAQANWPPQEVQPWSGWLVNDEARPQPPRVTPAVEAGGAPSDAVVLFDGTNLDAWDGGVNQDEGVNGRWVVRDGVMFPEGQARDLVSKESFGDCQLHLEFRVPEGRKLDGQLGANSGVFLLGRYEIQINQGAGDNTTYPDGMAGAVYGQQPPLADAGHRQGQWQSYDIIFRAPRFDEAGVVTEAGSIVVMMNGVCVQSGWEFQGQTSWRKLGKWEAHPEKAPLSLQFHGDPIEFRNVWIRELPRYGMDRKG